MRTLLVYRHAHARRARRGTDDHARPLSERGERDARRMGRRLDAEGLVPDRVLASTAVRARDTARLAGEEGGFADRIETVDDLYEARVEDCLEVARRNGGDAETLMIVGHNPSFQDLVRTAGNGVEGMPPGAVGVVAVDAATWEALELEGCFLIRILGPRRG